MVKRSGFLTVTMFVGLAYCGVAAGQTGYAEIETPATVPEAGDRLAKEGPGAHFQVGYAVLAAASYADEHRDDFHFTGDLNRVDWSRTRATWGFGVHFAVDGNGNRLGLRGLWRMPLKVTDWGYVQLASGVYISASDNSYDTRLPGWFFEAELGTSRNFAFVLAGEVIPYDYRYVGSTVSGYDREPVYERGTATNLYVGAKVGQKGAVVATGVLVLVATAAVASLASGGVM